MERLISYLVYFISLILLISFSIIFLTENSNIVSKLYKNDIINSIQKSSSLTYDFKKLSVQWTGLDPSLIFEEVSLHNEKAKQHYLDSEKLIIKINLFKSLSEMRIISEEVNLVKSNIDLVFDNNGIFIKDYNFLSTSKDVNKFNANSIKYRISDSNIRVYDKINSHSHELININMVILKQNDDIELFTTFNHRSSKEIIHLASSFSIHNNKINGKVYSQGVNININDPIHFYKNMSATFNKLNYIFWAEISDNNIINVHGNFGVAQSILSNNLTKDRIIFDKFNSQVSYNNANNQDQIKLTNMSFGTKDNKYKENYIKLTRKDEVLSSLSINSLYVNDLKSLLRLFTMSSLKLVRDSIDQIIYGHINNIHLNNIHDKTLLKYMFSFDETRFQNKTFMLSNISGKIKGDYQKGYLKLNSQDVDVLHQSTKFPISKVNGDIYLKYINGKILMSSSNLQLDDSHTAKILGSFSPEWANYQVKIKGNIDNIFSQLPHNFNMSDKVKKTDINANYNIDYRVYQKNNKTHAYGTLLLSDLLLSNNSADITFNAKKIHINFFDKYYQSSNSEIFVNDTKFLFSLDTDISDKQIRYIANSSGLLSDLFIKRFVKHNLIDSFEDVHCNLGQNCPIFQYRTLKWGDFQYFLHQQLPQPQQL